MNSLAPEHIHIPNERLLELAGDVMLDSFVIGPLDARDLSAALLELVDARGSIANLVRKPNPSPAPDLDASAVAQGLREAASLCDETAPALRERLKSGAQAIDKLVAAVGAALLIDAVRDSEMGDALRDALTVAGAL